MRVFVLVEKWNLIFRQLKLLSGPGIETNGVYVTKIQSAYKQSHQILRQGRL